MRLTTNKLSRLQFTGIILATITVMAIMGIAYYYNEKQLAEDKQYNIIKSVAKLKAEQVALWYNNILVEAAYYSSDLPVVVMEDNTGSNIKIDYSLLSSSMQKVMHDHKYENIMLTDTSGKLLFSVQEFYKIGMGTVNCISGDFNNKQITVNDLHYCSEHKKMHFDVIVPLIFDKNSKAGGNKIAVCMIFRIDPEEFLFPLINSWPGDNKTAEIVLGRATGNSVLLLNKRDTKTRLPKEIELNKDGHDLPVAQAVMGKTGRFRGIDYAGNMVLSELRQIPGTPWSMVVKMNTSEIYGELYIKVTVVSLSIIVLVMGLFVALTNQNSRLVKENERRMTSIVSHLPGFIYRCRHDAGWSTLYISDGCRLATGYHPDEFAHNDHLFNDLIEPEYRQFVADTISAALKKNDFFELEYPISHKSGEQRWMHERGKGVYLGTGEVMFIEGYVEDITKNREANHALLIAKEKAEESDRLKSAFLANMSHEIRTPMNGILGFLELMKEPDLSDDDKNDYLSLMNISGQRLLNTINDIIEISKIESGKLEYKESVVELEEVFSFYVDFFRPEADLKKIKIYIGSQISTEDSLIYSDRHKLDGILTNLIKNAIKFTKSGSIEISNALDSSDLLIWVKDTGKGIPAKRQQAIFERFIQAETNVTREHEGSGLGLAIVKAYVDSMGGRIWVESEQGRGSTFYIRLPYKKVSSSTVVQAKSKVENAKQSLFNKKTILIAEDDDLSYTLLKQHLKPLGIDILRAVNGRECINIFESTPGICLIMMDIQMPQMDGYQVTAHIRKLNEHLPIIAQTAYALEGDKERAIEAGCTDYVTKPLSKDVILGIVEKWM